MKLETKGSHETNPFSKPLDLGITELDLELTTRKMYGPIETLRVIAIGKDMDLRAFEADLVLVHIKNQEKRIKELEADNSRLLEIASEE